MFPHKLLGVLEDLREDDFTTFKWYLTMKHLEPCRPIPKSRLEKASRVDTVSRLIESYGEELAVNITVKVLREMNINNAAEKLMTINAEAVDGESA